MRPSGDSIRRCSASIPTARPIDAASLCVQAPVGRRSPAAGRPGCRDRVRHGRRLDAETGREGSVQLQVLTTKPDATRACCRSRRRDGRERAMDVEQPARLLCDSRSSSRTEAPQAADRGVVRRVSQLFPAALCYTKIVPVDEVVTLTLFYREDDQLARLMLDDDAEGRSSTGSGTSCTSSARMR